MDFDIVRQNGAYKKFSADVASGNVSHAYIILGEDETLRETFLTLACMRLLCPTACGECASCRSVLQGSYVELIRLNAKDKVPESAISELTENVSINPVIGNKKIAVIDNAELLTARAQNKLLKTYEEPPEYLTFFLGAGHESGLLATIRSRAKKLFLQELPSSVIEKILIDDGVNQDDAMVAAAFSMGNYSRALKFCEDVSYRQIYDDTFDMMLNLKKSSQVVEYVYKDIFGKDKILVTFGFMEIVLCDIMKMVTNSGAPLYTVNREYDLKKIAEGFSSQSVAMSIIAINEGRKRLNANMNANGVAGTVLMEILEAKYKWQNK